MIWLAMAGLALLVMAPLLLAAVRRARPRGRQEAALALHRAQLTELDRDLAQGRLLPEEHAGAKLEVERRLLADAALVETPPPRTGRLALAATALGVPLAAIALYIVSAGHPGPPPPPVDTVPDPASARPAEEVAREDQEIGVLQNRLKLMDPNAPHTIEGYRVLGQAELDRKRLPEAADAFRRVLAFRFDPTLGAETAEIITESEGKITPEAQQLFERALAEAPPNAPWRPMAERRLEEAKGS